MVQTVPIQGSVQSGILSQLISKKVNVSVCDGCVETAFTASMSLPEQFTILTYYLQLPEAR